MIELQENLKKIYFKMELRKITRNKKKGSIMDIFLFMILAFITILFIVIIFYASTTIKNELNKKFSTMDVEQTAVNKTIGEVITSYSALKWGIVVIIVGMFLSIAVTGFIVRFHPIFLVAFVFLVVIAVIVSVPISNTYATLTTEKTLSSTFAEFSTVNFIMSKLPIWIAIVGFGSAIVMFAKYIRSRDE